MRVGVFDVCFTNFTHKVACKLKKKKKKKKKLKKISSQNLNTATKTCPTLNKTHLTPCLAVNV